MTTSALGARADLAESARVRALAGLGLWGSAPEERFDRITRVARELFGVGAAMITLLAHDTLWLKSAQGFPIGFSRRIDVFCDHTIREADGMVVPDAAADPRFAANPFVVGAPHVRFYAGHPLAVGDGHRVGTLCLLDPRPRTFADHERHRLAALARWARDELLNLTEMDRAEEVQRALQPHAGAMTVRGHDLAGACFPSRVVGGDLLDWHENAAGDVIATLGDVMGKGMGAAIMMATVRTTMRAAVRLDAPGGALHSAAEALEEDLASTSTIVTVCQMRISPTTGDLAVSDAGHGLCLVVRTDGRCEQLPAGGLPLGVLADETWPEYRTRLDVGDTVIAFSDGLIELYGDDMDVAIEEMRRVCRSSPDTRRIVDHFAGIARATMLTDDVALFAFRRTPAEGGVR